MSELIEVPKRHYKGLLFDDLVYRYKCAVERLALYEEQEAKREGDRTYIYKKKDAQQDIIKFICLLDEAIGEHD